MQPLGEERRGHLTAFLYIVVYTLYLLQELLGPTLHLLQSNIERVCEYVSVLAGKSGASCPSPQAAGGLSQLSLQRPQRPDILILLHTSHHMTST